MAEPRENRTDYYPITSFSFRVNFATENKYDLEFQSVAGLQAQIETESIKEGGVNNYEHVVPTRRKYSDLVLKRGVVIGKGSAVLDWVKKCFAGMDKGKSISPANLEVVLLNDNNDPLMSWEIKHAWPKSWKYSDLSAEKGEILIETLEFNYNEFTIKKEGYPAPPGPPFRKRKN